ncbi:MAG: N-formylglutamate amidohydrolase [Gemmatimonadota bacterium]
MCDEWREPALLVTAEHGGNHVPGPYREIFAPHGELLRSHRGWDPGSLHLARRLARILDGWLIEATVTRLLVDLNRSRTNPRVFSQITRPLPPAERALLLHGYHRPHWDTVESSVAGEIGRGRRVLHLSIHSFTPSLNGATRSQDLALLYDPRSAVERCLAGAWIAALRRAEPALRLRRNHPYRGRADGVTTALRKRFGADVYAGIEVEVNQRHVREDGRFPAWIPTLLADTLARIPDPSAAWRSSGRSQRRSA